MTTPRKSTVPGITVRLPPPLRAQVAAIARMEHSSTAAYIEALVERDIEARREASRVIQIHVATGLPDRPAGEVTRAAGEAQAAYEARAGLLDSLFGV